MKETVEQNCSTDDDHPKNYLSYCRVQSYLPPLNTCWGILAYQNKFRSPFSRQSCRRPRNSTGFDIVSQPGLQNCCIQYRAAPSFSASANRLSRPSQMMAPMAQSPSCRTSAA